MKWLFRPSMLVVVSAALALSAMALVFWPRPLENKAAPLPVQDGDQEIVWLYAATSPANWERFVRGVETVVDRLRQDMPELGIELHKRDAFPAETTTVPEAVVSAKETRGQLRFRWYKLTSDQKTDDWVKALLERRPPPLALIGGSSSDLGIELARSLQAGAEQHRLRSPVGHDADRAIPATRSASYPTAPLLLLTTATADDDPSAGDEPLISIYAGRTFRFCFTNRQMAAAVVDFIWGQNDLRPDSDPVYLIYWNDDPYSKDLMPRYLDALRLPAARGATHDWAGLASFAVVGGFPLDGTLAWGRFRLETPRSASIPYSLGSFGRPNRWEVEEGGRLIEWKLKNQPDQRRALLVLPAGTQPTRRFLRTLVRFAPEEARNFVVATGDSLAFNTLYRDRNFAWPIQDLPFSLICFFHRNPVDPQAGFLPENAAGAAEPDEDGRASAGTEDLLLYVDMSDALVQAAFCQGSGKSAQTLPSNAEELRTRLGEARWSKALGRVSFDPVNAPLFDEQGDRCSGTGEHIVSIQPIVKGKEVLPAAKFEIWVWEAGSVAGERRWRRQATLPVRYDGFVGQESEGEEK